ncbi:hypothetical protein ACFQ21_20570 [Ohtaekwangia kribbensis]|uniref:Uncharacterized protein n=1 Tax=Ohtaekwangia kribbensis TaxID=688913 RepID=A0ABW3K7E4_9BACT
MKVTLPEGVSLIKIPATAELAIYMIHKELRNRRIITKLEDAGFDSSNLSFDLTEVILQLVGIQNDSNKTYEWYIQLQDKYTALPEPEEPSEYYQQALDFYIELKGVNR